MNIKEIKKELTTSAYDFLRREDVLSDNIILLGVGGSHAYGTNVDDSDLDIRGVATNSRMNILMRKDFEEYDERETDTVIYSIEKMVKLLSNCNPNTIEILGLKPEHYIYLSDAGRLLLENKDIFLSKKAIYSFGGYANSQLRRLEHKAAKPEAQQKREINILKSIENAKIDFRDRYSLNVDDVIELYIDKSSQVEFETEIFMDINLKHTPLRDYVGMWAEMQNIVRSYSKVGKRNQNAIEHDKLAKHMMHLIRLYFMCFDILEKGKIITYRENEHDFLMDIRKGKYLDDDRQPTKEFYEIVDELQNGLEMVSKKCTLPNKVDNARIDKLLMEINYIVINKGDGKLYEKK